MGSPDGYQHSEPGDDIAYANTDRELWREGDPEDGMSYYEPSIHVTEQGGIGINVGGTVYVKTLREWHGIVEQLEARDAITYTRDPSLADENERLREQLETVRRQGGWASAEMHARTADRYEAALKRIAEDTEPNHYSRLQGIAREALYPASRPSS